MGRPLLAAAASLVTMAPSLPNPELIQVADEPIEIDDAIRVATTNVHSWESLRGKSNIGAFIHFLDEYKPDIVCGQEAILSSKFPDAEVQKRGYSTVKAPTRLLPFVDNGAYGNFLLSKFEIISFEVHALDSSFDMGDLQKVFRPRNFIHAELAREDGSTQAVIVPHLEGEGNDDITQLQEVIGYIATEIPDRPVIVCGDMNNNMLLQDIAGMSPPPPLWPSLATAPVEAPDRVLDSIRVANAGQSSVTDYQTWDIGSDHLALTALVNIS